MMKIINLKNEPQHLEKLAQWHHEEWFPMSPMTSYELRIKNMQSYLKPGFIPSMFIGKDGDESVGSAAIVEHDLETHKELSPWLAAVYVAADHRKHGYGGLLVKHIMQQAQAQGIKKLYLFTPNQQDFYAKLGWIKKFDENYKGLTVTIMEVNLV